MKDAIRKLVEGEHLSRTEAESAMEQIMDGEATPAQIAALIVALRIRGETTEEITGFAEIMRQRARAVPCVNTDLVDTCGTGGDSLNTFNISTAAAFVAAGAGVRVAKHGNRAMSSRCGSADVLQGLGVNIEMSPEEVAECIDLIGVGFLFAQRFHPSMKYAAGPRSEVGVRTIFNMLGPLTNPAGACRQVMGVYDGRLTDPIAHVLKNLGAIRAMVCHGACGIDEISLVGETQIAELKDGNVTNSTLFPDDFGMPACSVEDLRGGDVEINKQILLAVLHGTPGHPLNAVLMNAAAAILVADIAASWDDAVAAARASVKSGAATQKLQALCDFSQAT